MVPSPITQESSQSSEVGTTNISLYTLFCGSQTTANSTDTNRRQSRSAGCGSWIFSGATSLLSAGYPLWTVTNFAEQDVVADSGHDFVKGMNVVPVHRVFAAGFATRIVGGGRQSQAGPCCECVSEGVGCRDCGRPFGYRSKTCSAHIEGAVGLDGIRLRSGRFTYHFYEEATSCSSTPAFTVCVPRTSSQQHLTSTRRLSFGSRNLGVEGIPFMAFEITDTLHATPPFPHDGPSTSTSVDEEQRHSGLDTGPGPLTADMYPSFPLLRNNQAVPIPRRDRQHRHTTIRRLSTVDDEEDEDRMPGLTIIHDSDDGTWPLPARNPDYTEDWSQEYLSNMQAPTYIRPPASTWPIPTHGGMSGDVTVRTSNITAPTRQRHYDADDSDSHPMPGLRDVSDSSEDEDDGVDPESDSDDEYDDDYRNPRSRSTTPGMVDSRPLPYGSRARLDEIERRIQAQLAAEAAHLVHAGEAQTSSGALTFQPTGARLRWDPTSPYQHTADAADIGLTTIGRNVLNRQAGHAHHDSRRPGLVIDPRYNSNRRWIYMRNMDTLESTLLASRTQAQQMPSSSRTPAQPDPVASTSAASEPAALGRTPPTGDPSIEDEDKIEEDELGLDDSMPALVADIPWSPFGEPSATNRWGHTGTYDRPLPDFALMSHFNLRRPDAYDFQVDEAREDSHVLADGAGALLPNVTFFPPIGLALHARTSGILLPRSTLNPLASLEGYPNLGNAGLSSSDSEKEEEWVTRRASWLAWRDTPSADGGEGWDCRGTVLSGARRPWAAR